MNETIQLVTNLYKNKSYMKWNQMYNKDTLLSITKTDRLEQSHSFLIKYILDPNENHTLGTMPLELFMRLLLVKNANVTINPILQRNMNELLKKVIQINVWDAKTEKADRQVRYDIYIETIINNIKSIIIIENKVLSTENENQTTKYTYYSKNYENPILVYLSNNDVSKSPNFICITYQELLDYVIEPLYNYTENVTTKQLLRDYIRILSHIEDGERSVTLAMSNEERKLLRYIYKENQEMFERMVESLTTEDLTEEEKETYRKVVEISKSHRVRWSYKGQIFNNKELVLNIVKEQLQSGNSIEQLSKFKMHSDPMVVLEEKTKDDGYTKQELNGLIYYVRTCCDTKDVSNLIKGLDIDVMKVEM